MSNETADEVLKAWETSSQYWNKHQALIEKMFVPLTQALIEEAQIVAGQSVLDIGGGSGEPSLTIAGVVGPSGRVTFTDPTAGMVKASRERAQQRGLKNIEFHQAGAEKLPFADNSFDVAVGRLSSMFFSDVPGALREILRVLKPGGRLAFLVWADREFNPFFTVIGDVLNQFVPAEPEGEDAPTAFRFARPGKLANLLAQAGAVSVKEHTLKFDTEAPIDSSQFWAFRTEMSDSFRTKLGKLGPAEVNAARDAVVKASAPYFQSGTMRFPSQALIVSGRKPEMVGE
ncbi:MAG TPA: methyltransferase domain-containing protein [Pyrinomonadaceae bacterium]|nr:methyltransferase domain-containing protein [Pyrinomonadaceae bacterium]